MSDTRRRRYPMYPGFSVAVERLQSGRWRATIYRDDEQVAETQLMSSEWNAHRAAFDRIIDLAREGAALAAEREG